MNPDIQRDFQICISVLLTSFPPDVKWNTNWVRLICFIIKIEIWRPPLKGCSVKQLLYNTAILYMSLKFFTNSYYCFSSVLLRFAMSQKLLLFYRSSSSSKIFNKACEKTLLWGIQRVILEFTLLLLQPHKNYRLYQRLSISMISSK